MTKVLWFLFLGSLASLAVADDSSGSSSGNSSGSSSSGSSSSGKSSDRSSDRSSGDRRIEAKFFLATTSTTTKTVLSVTTSTTPLTCVLKNNAAPCAGRRRTRVLSLSKASAPGINISDQHLIDSSMDEQGREGRDRSGNESPKTFLTIWSTATSTATVTAFATNTGVKVSISAYCTIAPGAFPPMC